MVMLAIRVIYMLDIHCPEMDHVAELPTAEASETTAGEFRECRTRFALKLKARAEGGRKGENPMTTSCPGSWMRLESANNYYI